MAPPLTPLVHLAVRAGAAARLVLPCGITTRHSSGCVAVVADVVADVVVVVAGVFQRRLHGVRYSVLT